MQQNQVDKTNLGYLGIEFQYKLVKIFVEESGFYESIASITDQNAFNDPLLRKTVGILKDYHSKHGVVPSYEMLNTILREKARTTVDIQEADAIIDRLRNTTSIEGYSYVKESSLKFFKQQNMVKVANKILDLVGKGDLDNYEGCQKMLEEAMASGQEDDYGFNIYDMEEKALSNEYTVSIPTGIDKLDDVLGGGLDKGKLGLIIAPAGFGKTSFTTAIDSYAASYRCDVNNNQGYKVLQIYFEDDDVDITRKHFSRLTQTEARYFKRLDKPTREEIAGMLENHPYKEMLMQNLRLKRFKTGTKSASDIEVFIRRLINTGFKPDLVSIDYFECLAPEKGGRSNDTEWTKEGVTMRKLENMAQELNCAIWIPTQGTKDSINSPDMVRMDQAGGSIKKVHVAQLIISIARAINDIDRSRATVTILKNRSGKSGKIFNNVYFDNGTSTIRCSDIQEFDDDLVWQEEQEKMREEVRNTMVRKLVDKPTPSSEFDDDEIEMDMSHGTYVGNINDVQR